MFSNGEIPSRFISVKTVVNGEREDDLRGGLTRIWANGEHSLPTKDTIGQDTKCLMSFLRMREVDSSLYSRSASAPSHCAQRV